VWRNNNLSIVLFASFLFCLAGHAFFGWKAYDAEQRQQGAPEVSLSEFVRTSEFGETVFENWESEFFQMGFYVLLTVFLYQKGSSESKKYDGNDEVDEDPRLHRGDPHAPYPVKAGGWRLALYKRSLSIALFLLFLISFLGHAAAGARKWSHEQHLQGSAESVGTFGYMAKPAFWYESFQNWQSEFLAVFAIVVLSIWLRQWGSPESKPVHSPHEETGSG
jgi:uncharacterized protein DUF6766